MDTQTVERPAGRTKRTAEPPAQVKTLNLALQGGGAHGAFAWGVLDRLLEDGRIAFEGVSATSAGAMNAVVLAYGLGEGGREGARMAPSPGACSIACSRTRGSRSRASRLPAPAP